MKNMLVSHLPAHRFRAEKIRAIAATGGRILDVGGGARFTKWLKEYERDFANTRYETLDMDRTTNPDIVGDIHEIPLADASIDAMICSSVLEHVTDPKKAVSEMRRVLKPNGSLFVYVPSIYPYHVRKDVYGDYWRFFDDTLELLFSDWSSMELCKVGGIFTALSFFVPFQHRLQFFLRPFSKGLDSFTGSLARTTTSGYMAYVRR
ncbi:MAG: class I SAM-dependent methyltransferase [Patescibacteria group bacterium]|nr:class I SAM-dependent methyltransferase [Patescibacteria group bacterium]